MTIASTRMTLKMSALSDGVLETLLDTRSSVLFVGGPGVGKTSRIEQFASGKLPVVTVSATSGDAPDVAGFPMPVKQDDGSRVTRYTLSPLLTRIRDTGAERGVLLLDELPQADSMMQKALSPAFFEHRLGDFKLPEGWAVWATGNRIADRAGVNKMLSHLRNRLSVVELEADLDGWVDWAQDNDVHPMGIGFAKFRPGLVFANEVPSGEEPYCSPRSLTNAIKFLSARADGMRLPDDPVSHAFVQGFIGTAAAHELLGFLKTYQFLPTPEELLKAPDKAKVPPVERFDAQYAAMSMAISLADVRNVDKVATYVTRLNKELQTSAFRSLLSRAKGAFLNSPVIQQWTRENAGLVHVSI